MGFGCAVSSGARLPALPFIVCQDARVCGKAAGKLCCALLCWWRLLPPVFSVFMLPSLALCR